MGAAGKGESIYSSNTHPSCQGESKADKEGTDIAIFPHTQFITVHLVSYTAKPLGILDQNLGEWH